MAMALGLSNTFLQLSVALVCYVLGRRSATAVVQRIYISYTGTILSQDRQGFANAGGLDIVGWAPWIPVTFLPYYLSLYWPIDKLTLLRAPFYMTLSSGLSAVFAYILSDQIFKRLFGPRTAPDSWEDES